MCLTWEFFEKRGDSREKYLKQGYTDIDDLFESKQISLDLLCLAGLIQEKEICSTAELNNWELSDDGKRYLKEFKRAQLIMVKPGNLEPLLNCLKKNSKA